MLVQRGGGGDGNGDLVSIAREALRVACDLLGYDGTANLHMLGQGEQLPRSVLAAVLQASVCTASLAPLVAK